MKKLGQWIDKTDKQIEAFRRNNTNYSRRIVVRDLYKNQYIATITHLMFEDAYKTIIRDLTLIEETDKIEECINMDLSGNSWNSKLRQLTAIVDYEEYKLIINKK